ISITEANVHRLISFAEFRTPTIENEFQLQCKNQMKTVFIFSLTLNLALRIIRALVLKSERACCCEQHALGLRGSQNGSRTARRQSRPYANQRQSICTPPRKRNVVAHP
ncbi:MAG TPA: hypothetical protein VFR05_04565, partial [Terriglobia bacterium]|nr:hypothetical protein [Terriglobia bacterium]